MQPISSFAMQLLGIQSSKKCDLNVKEQQYRQREDRRDNYRGDNYEDADDEDDSVIIRDSQMEAVAEVYPADLQDLEHPADLEDSEHQQETPTHRPRRRRAPEIQEAQKFRDIFPDNHEAVEIYNRLISSCRMMFIRFLDILEPDVDSLIKRAAHYDLESTSVAYNRMYKRILEWKKNWFQAYLRSSANIHSAIEREKGWANLPLNELKDAYKGMYGFEYVHSMFENVHAGTIDWHATMNVKPINTLLRNMFTWTMV
jgi:hypothetical protein